MEVVGMVEKISSALADAYQLLDLSMDILENIEHVPLSELPKVLSFVRKNIRDAMGLINSAEAEFDEMVREIDEEEEKELLEEPSRGERHES